MHQADVELVNVPELLHCSDVWLLLNGKVARLANPHCDEGEGLEGIGVPQLIDRKPRLLHGAGAFGFPKGKRSSPTEELMELAFPWPSC